MMNHGNHLKLIGAAGAVLLVLAALGLPVLSYLPVLAIAAVCPLMMVVMMRGMDHGGGSSEDDGTGTGHRTGHRH